MNNMDVRFDKILDFNYKPAEKLHNSFYLEDLSSLLSRTASKISDGSNYRFEKDFYVEISKQGHNCENKSYKHFVESFKQSFYYGSSKKINIIRGQAGVGKTKFLDKGFQKVIYDKNDNKQHRKYIKLCVDLKNIDEQKEALFYLKMIYSLLKEKAQEAIIKLGNEYWKIFLSKYQKYKDLESPLESLFPVIFFCKTIYQIYNQPCIIIFDNIDLADFQTQINVYRATVNVCDTLYENMVFCNMYDYYRVYFAMRPETYTNYAEVDIGNIIDFPLPNILKICLNVIEETIREIAQNCDANEKLKCEVEYYNIFKKDNVTAKNFSDIAEYFIQILEHYLIDIWDSDPQIKDRLGNSEDFHCNIVNYNIRTFLNFLSDTIGNGGFLPLTKDFNAVQSEGYYSLFNYIEMIIHGRWKVHPGNSLIDYNARDKAPIIFNMFDTSLLENRQEIQVKHFMLNIRILQYFTLRPTEGKIFYKDLINDLRNFFDEEYIEKYTKKLVFTRILYSSEEGDRSIASKHHFEDVFICEKTILMLSETGKFYIEKLICEFEYLYQMALSSIMPSDFVDELSAKWQYEKELTVFHFLQGIFVILNENLESYDEKNLILFEKLFCQDNKKYCKPYRRILNAFVSVMKNKVQRAERNNTKSLYKLKNILFDAESLEKKAMNYFSSKLNENRHDIHAALVTKAL